MMDNKDNRDVLDVAASNAEAYPDENMPKKAARPTVSPQEGGYFLNKFLDQSQDQNTDAPTEEEEAASSPAPTASQEKPEEKPESVDALQRNIISALQEIYDPEIPVNIYELGLIYEVDVSEDYSVKVRMTLTTPHCPVAESMPGEVELKVTSVTGVKSCEVMLVWEPAWDMSMMSDEARLELGLL